MILEVICGIFCGLSFRRGCREERGCSSGEMVKMVKKGHHDQHTTNSISSAINAQLTKSANKTCYSSDKDFRIRPICKIDLQHARKYCIVIFYLNCSPTHKQQLYNINLNIQNIPNCYHKAPKPPCTSQFIETCPPNQETHAGYRI